MPPEVLETVKEVDLLAVAAQNGNWVLFTGILITLLIYLLDRVIKLKDHLPSAAVPWVAAGMGILGAIGVQLTTGITWQQALLQGFMSGAMAVGLWEMIFKKVLIPNPPAPAASPVEPVATVVAPAPVEPVAPVPAEEPVAPVEPAAAPTEPPTA